MKKQIKKIAKVLGIYFSKEEQLIYGLSVGDIININDESLEKIKEGKKKKHGKKK